VTDQLRAKLPKLVAMMDEAEHEVLTFMDFPKEHWVKIHSTNVLEATQRRDQAPRRRGRHLPQRERDPPSRALLMEQNDEYAIQNRYISLELLALLSENPPIRPREGHYNDQGSNIFVGRRRKRGLSSWCRPLSIRSRHSTDPSLHYVRRLGEWAKVGGRRGLARPRTLGT